MLNIYSFMYFDSIFGSNQEMVIEPKCLTPFLLVFTKLPSNFMPVVCIEKHHKKWSNKIAIILTIGIFLFHYPIPVYEKV